MKIWRKILYFFGINREKIEEKPTEEIKEVVINPTEPEIEEEKPKKLKSNYDKKSKGGNYTKKKKQKQ